LGDSVHDEHKRKRYKRIDEEVPDGFLAKGAYGRVYIAEDTKTGDVVAIKKQRYPSDEVARELAFAKVLASSPSALMIRFILRFSSRGGGGGFECGGRGLGRKGVGGRGGRMGAGSEEEQRPSAVQHKKAAALYSIGARCEDDRLLLRARLRGGRPNCSEALLVFGLRLHGHHVVA
jgi:hypothetical protein